MTKKDKIKRTTLIGDYVDGVQFFFSSFKFQWANILLSDQQSI